MLAASVSICALIPFYLFELHAFALGLSFDQRSSSSSSAIDGRPGYIIIYATVFIIYIQTIVEITDYLGWLEEKRFFRHI
jgi:hypothetical protein